MVNLLKNYGHRYSNAQMLGCISDPKGEIIILNTTFRKYNVLKSHTIEKISF